MISSTNRRAGPFDGNGSTTDFPFSFKVFKAADVVAVQVAPNGVETSPSIASVTLNPNQDVSPGGVVRLTAPLPLLNRLVITSALAPLQPMQLTNGGGFFPRVLNDMADRLTILIQQLLTSTGNVLRAPVTDFVALNPIPNSLARAGKLLGFDSAGQPVPVTPGSGGNGGIADAPTDGKDYIRRNAAWFELVVSGAAAAGTLLQLPLLATLLASPPAIPANISVVQTAGYSEQGVGGALYAFSSAVDAAYVAANPRSCFLAADGRGFRIMDRLLHCAQFGAKGDGVTNDTDALVAWSRELGRRGGGTGMMDPRVYRVGYQGAWTSVGKFGPSPINPSAATRKVTLHCNGAILDTAPNLQYGSFNPATNQPRTGQSVADRASPFEGGLYWVNTVADLEVNGLNVRGSNTTFVNGGDYGDTGRQIPHNAFYIVTTGVASGRIVMNDCSGYQMGQDGLLLQITANRTSARRPAVFNRCYFDENGRQGCSQVGGRGVVFNYCRFNRTGRAGVSSAPAAGFDLEAEGANINRETEFNNCDFVDNLGNGMVADTGDSRGATFRMCRFVGTTVWSAFPNKPEMKFEDCLFVGALAGIYVDPTGADSVRFTRCRFSDDPTLSPTGVVYGSRIIDAGGANTQVSFDACVFDLNNGMGLPYHPGGARYNNSTLKQTNGGLDAVLSATWTGFNTITAASPNLVNSTYAGIVRLNGTVVSPPAPKYAQRFNTVGGSGIAAGATVTQRVFGFDGTAATAIVLDAYGQGPNADNVNAGPASARVGARYADGADIIVKNDHTSTQFLSVGVLTF